MKWIPASQHMPNQNLVQLNAYIETAAVLELISQHSHPICLSGAWGQKDIGSRYDVLSSSPIITIRQYCDGQTSYEGHTLYNEELEPSSIEAQQLDGLEFLEHYLQNSQGQQYNAASSPGANSLPSVFGFIGYISYDYGRRLENLPEQTSNDTNLPVFNGGIYNWNFINDTINSTSYISFHPSCPETQKREIRALFDSFLKRATANTQRSPHAQMQPFKLTSRFSSETSKKSYMSAFSLIERYIKEGDCYQVNFSHRHHANYTGRSANAFSQINASINTPFSAYLKFEDHEILSFSPERFIRVIGNSVETKPIKGTINRGATKREDAALQKQLSNSEKDKSENLMIVDLLRNDLNRTCLPGSVKVPTLFEVETYPNVHHLVSTIIGTKPETISALEVLKQAFPGGSITGAPKVRAMEIIEELETHRRSIYCGSIFYADFNGNMDSNICIRTMLCKEGDIYCWGGGGIVADSDSEAEYLESTTKIKNLMDELEKLSGLEVRS